jgi:hypothetical protein
MQRCSDGWRQTTRPVAGALLAAPDECWEWTGARNGHGYGRLNRGGHSGATIKAHRASYEIHHGVDPGELDVCHRCDNPPCVNPAHLFLGDAKANAQDMARKGRAGPQNGQGLLIQQVTDAQVRELREKAAAGTPHDRLAADYGLGVPYVGMLTTGYVRASAGGPFSRRANGNEKHTDETIRRLRERAAAGEPLTALAAEYGAHRSYVSLIVHGHVRKAAGGPIR